MYIILCICIYKILFIDIKKSHKVFLGKGWSLLGKGIVWRKKSSFLGKDIW
jgi:hypothetical protein